MVLVRESHGRVAFFFTNHTASVADILGCVADRFSLEKCFRYCKDVVGAGRQQVRFLGANVGAFHICPWTVTPTEAWAWPRSGPELTGHRTAGPWDDESRRPSHADKRRAWRRELLTQEIQAVLRAGPNDDEIQTAAERLTGLAA